MSKTDLFVEKSKIKHGDLYDYSKSIYTHSRTPVIIGCKTHGDFLQKPVHHQLGRGCQKCAKVKIGDKIRKIAENKRILGFFKKAKENKQPTGRIYVHKTTEWFVGKAISTHGENYDYSQCVYTGTKNKLDIVCKKHGTFSQVAYYHLQGKGCTACGLERMKWSHDDFITKSLEAHGCRYDYSKTLYKGYNAKVSIVCKTHGVFNQNAGCHLNGQGCAKCAQEENGWSRSRHTKAAERNNHSMIYLIECFNDKERFYKVGITTHTINRRFNGKECMPYSFNVLCTKTDGAKNDWNNEKTIHSKLKEFKYTPLIRFKGDGECFLELNDYAKQFFGVAK